MTPEEKLAIVWVIFMLFVMCAIAWAVWNGGN